MLEVALISLVAPVVVGGALLVMRKRQPRLATDTRGIALQTVIIIVVLLAIAGSVAGVLLSRAADVTGELESAEVGVGVGRNSASCVGHNMTLQGRGTNASNTTEVAGVWSSGDCTWSGTAGANGYSVTTAQCHLIRGTVTTAATATVGGVCTVDNP